MTIGSELVSRLRWLLDQRKPYSMPGGTPQTMGCETWRIVAAGSQLDCVEDAADYIEALEARLAAAIETLTLCRQKLHLYRANQDGKYLGGMEFTALIKRIDEARSPPNSGGDGK